MMEPVRRKVSTGARRKVRTSWNYNYITVIKFEALSILSRCFQRNQYT